MYVLAHGDSSYSSWVIDPNKKKPLKALNWVKNIKPTERGVNFDIETVTNAYVKKDEVDVVVLCDA